MAPHSLNHMLRGSAPGGFGGFGWFGRCAWFVLCTALGVVGLARTGAADARARKPSRSKLTVVVVIDQLPSWLLDRVLGQLQADGAIRQTIERGAYMHQVEYSYASTYTAPGHAAIFTGAPPRDSGIDGNKIWDPTTGRKRSSMEDGVHAVFGVEGKTAGPRATWPEGVADMLKRTYPGSRVVSLSLKDRGAITAAGTRAESAWWYEPKAKGFTTSSYYVSQIPPWVQSWHQQNPLSARWASWEALDPQRWGLAVGADQVTGEDNPHRLGTTFPHSLKDLADPYAAVVYTPTSTLWMLDFARHAIDQHQLCTDAAPDLLTLSISSTDYVGHAYGPTSWEALDHLVRVDAALGAWLTELRTRCELSVLITSDHGGAPLPEVSRAMGHTAYRLYSQELAAQADAALDRTFGSRDWIAGYNDGFLYWAADVFKRVDRVQVLRVAQGALRAVPGVHDVIDVQEAKRWGDDTDAYRRSISLGIAADSNAALWVIPAMWSVLMETRRDGDAGTTHGSPWHYDTRVPVVYAGPSVAHVESREPLPQCRVATTITSLLGAPKPPRACEDPLPGVRASGPYRSLRLSRP
jgi:hypothetical protein